MEILLPLPPGAGIKDVGRHTRLLTMLISGLRSSIKDTEGLLGVGVPIFCLSERNLGLEMQGGALDLTRTVLYP